MNKDNIYELIGYKGQYNKEVKAKLRKLLKKYHPDHNNGKSETFKLINEVKKELEQNDNIKNNNEVKETKQTSSNKEDFQYYQKQIKSLLKQNELLKNQIKEKNENIENIYKSYNCFNEKLIDNQGLLCENNDNVTYLKTFQKKYIIYILSFLLSAVFYFFTENIIFIILVSIVAIILFIDISKLYLNIKKITLENDNYLKKKIVLFKEIQDLKDKINTEKKELLSLERQLIKNSNDIRFYQNQINKNK